MYEAVYAKFSQNRDVQSVLLSTGDSELIEHTEHDLFWADGGDGSGQNKLGKILMKVRNRLMHEIFEQADRQSFYSIPSSTSIDTIHNGW